MLAPLTETYNAFACIMQVQMSDPDIASNATEFQKVARAAAQMEDQVSAYDKYKATQAALKEAKELLRESDGAYSLCLVYAMGVACPLNIGIHAERAYGSLPFELPVRGTGPGAPP